LNWQLKVERQKWEIYFSNLERKVFIQTGERKKKEEKEQWCYFVILGIVLQLGVDSSFL